MKAVVNPADPERADVVVPLARTGRERRRVHRHRFPSRYVEATGGEGFGLSPVAARMLIEMGVPGLFVYDSPDLDEPLVCGDDNLDPADPRVVVVVEMLGEVADATGAGLRVVWA